MSTRRKLVILLFVSLFAIILLFSGFIYYNLIEYSYADFHARLHTRALTTARIELESNREADYLKQFKAEYLEKLTNERHYVIDADTLDLNRLSARLDIPKSFITETLRDGDHFYKKGNTFYNAVRADRAGKKYLVIVSAENYYHTHHEVYLRQLLIGTIIFAVLLIFFLSYWISNRISKPLHEISTRVNEIGTDKLHLRIPEEDLPRELEILSKSFNVMLDRLETSFEAQKNFVSNASHEFRTPLTSIMGEADLALSRERAPQFYQDTLRVILTEAEKLNHKTQALLFLAQTGFKKSKLLFEPLRVDEVLLECKTTFHKIDPANKIVINFTNLPEQHQQLQILGNRQLLTLALTNIMGNGLKYSKNEVVEVSLDWEGEDIVIKIKDRGIGIPESELPFIYDPFFRASNTSEFEGYGIGLPLARNIIRLHKGELRILSAKDQGVTAEIKIPLRQN
ncbi:MAG: HAMP domain-containing protein [Leadbetterella sp.]|nr:HAMP domain-containing protein [Leadbetterella sp.]